MTITITRGKDEDAGTRYLSAEGRDVLVEEDQLTYDPATRTLALAGAGSRRQATARRRTAELTGAVIEVVTEKPGMNTREVEEVLRGRGVGFQRGDVGQAGRAATAAHLLRQEHGPRNSVLWFPRVLPSAPECSPREHGSSPHPSYRGGTTPRTTGPPPDPGALEPETEDPPSDST